MDTTHLAMRSVVATHAGTTPAPAGAKHAGSRIASSLQLGPRGLNPSSAAGSVVAPRRASWQPAPRPESRCGRVARARHADVTTCAFFIHPEPANALSLPTWAVHTSSVFEWGLAMRLIWEYAGVSGNERWKGLAWGMLPCLGSAMCACTWHFFYNATELEFLVALQAFLTVVGNFTCWVAAYRLCEDDTVEDVV